MPQQDYEQKKHECWEEFKREVQCLPVSRHDVFCAAFDRAYALGKQTVTITQEDVNKAAREYLLTRQQARHNAKKEEDATLRDFDKTIKAWDAFDMEQAYEDGANFALGKQEKDAENTPISERLAPEEKSQLEGIYYYLKRAADKQENESVSVAVLFEVMERLEDIFGIDLLTNGHGKLAPKDADTVIQGWVARDENGRLCLYQDEPKREAYDFQPRGYWTDKTVQYIDLPPNLFPDLTWESEPQEVEIIIKRKKENL